MPEFRPVIPQRPDWGLFSPAELRELMRIEFDRARRQGYDLACLCLAVDRFGHLQDLYGTDTTQTIQRGLHEILERATRVSDFPRGQVDDALLVLFPHTSPEAAAMLAQRLLDAARQLAFESDGRSVSITLSIGVVGNGDPGVEDLDSMAQRAQAGLALARAAGGGRWMRAEQASSELERLRRELDELRSALERQGTVLDEAQQTNAVLTRASLNERELELDTLRRRVAKLTQSLTVTEEELRRVMALKNVDAGVASIYRTVQGLSADASNAEARLEMLARIFELNLELRQQIESEGG